MAKKRHTAIGIFPFSSVDFSGIKYDVKRTILHINNVRPSVHLQLVPATQLSFDFHEIQYRSSLQEAVKQARVSWKSAK